MRILSVYIDLNEPQHQFDPIFNYLNSFNAGVRAGERLWFVKTGKKPDEVKEDILALSLPEGYQVLVFEVGGKWDTYCVKSEVSSWMGKHV